MVPQPASNVPFGSRTGDGNTDLPSEARWRPGVFVAVFSAPDEHNEQFEGPHASREVRKTSD